MTFMTALLVPVTALLAQAAPVAGAVNFETFPQQPGVWSYRSFPQVSEASFMDTSGTMRLSVRCARPTRQIVISRHNPAPAPTMFIWTSSQQRSLPAAFETNPTRVSAVLAANDSLLDAIAFSRGRIALSIPGALPLVVAPAPEAARVFEDCRN